MTSHVEIIAASSWVEIHLNRADKKNALTSDMYTAIANAFASAEADPGVQSIILTGRGAGFCAGNDLQDFLSKPLDDSSPVWRFLHAISTVPKVLIAATQGACVGVGATMLLHCDYVVAAHSTALQYSFAKMALVPEAASSLLLPRAVGHLKASELLLLGDPVLADEALGLGLVSRVVPEGEQLDVARAVATRISALPPQAVRLTKQLIKSESQGVGPRMAEEAAIFKLRVASPEFGEAVSAFMQKRAPKFSS
jgi:enoyl-CoA hydratase/carnithine racemase